MIQTLYLSTLSNVHSENTVKKSLPRNLMTVSSRYHVPNNPKCILFIVKSRRSENSIHGLEASCFDTQNAGFLLFCVTTTKKT